MLLLVTWYQLLVKMVSALIPQAEIAAEIAFITASGMHDRPTLRLPWIGKL